MLKKLLKKDQGFTLIEIVLVLAIAGLILVIVFLAVQGAQRGRRDNERRNAVARLLAAAEQVAGNNNGAYPNNTTDCAGGVNFGGVYNAGGYNCAAVGTQQAVGYSGPGSQCGANGAFVAVVPATTRIVAANIVLETGGVTYCQDND